MSPMVVEVDLVVVGLVNAMSLAPTCDCDVRRRLNWGYVPQIIAKPIHRLKLDSIACTRVMCQTSKFRSKDVKEFRSTKYIESLQLSDPTEDQTRKSGKM